MTAQPEELQTVVDPGELRDLFEAWNEYVAATTPVQQGACLLRFANAFHHFQVGVEERWSGTNRD